MYMVRAVSEVRKVSGVMAVRKVSGVMAVRVVSGVMAVRVVREVSGKSSKCSNSRKVSAVIMYSALNIRLFDIYRYLDTFSHTRLKGEDLP